MSGTIDQRVVEMRFDNKNFEQNVSTSMSTLEKLKQSLRLDGAAKGFQDIDSAAKKVNMSGLGSAVETVQAKFSALSVVGVTALANITNSAVNAGKRIVSALTIDPIKTGFQEYETQINAVQTILANTESKGSTINDVNKALDTLNLYADKTIYNFTEMTRNIGTFTAAGVDLETSVSAIQGIANMAAVSGSTSQQASVAMYQLSQALAAGTVKLMDWNSVVNAGMGGQVFQDALKETSRQMVKNADALAKMSTEQKKVWQESHGYTDAQMKSMEEYSFNVDELIKKHGSFRESLSEGWITADVLTTTLGKMTKTGVVEYVSDMTGATKESVTELQKLGDEVGYSNSKVKELALSIANGDEELAKSVISTVKMASTAEDAATKVKTLTQLWDTLKEAAQSGWTQTWETAIGDFEEAKELYTRISDVVGGMISASADARNQALGEGLSSGWKQFINAAEADEQLLKDSISSVAKELGVPLDELIEKNGSFEKSLKEGWMTSDILKKSVSGLADKTKGLTDEQLLSIGYTRDQATAIQELNKKIQQGEIDLDKFAESMGKVSGRENVIEGFANIFDSLIKVAKTVGEAFREIFPSITGEQIYSMTEKFREFTERLKVSGDTLDKIKRTFKGFFSILDMGKKIITVIFKPIAQLLGSDGFGSLGSSLLDITAAIGDFFTTLNQGFQTDGISAAFSKIATGISDAMTGIFGNLTGFGDLFSTVGDVICKVASNIWKAVSTVFGWITDHISIGDIFAGLAGGGIFVLAKKLGSFVDKIKSVFEGLFDKKMTKGLIENVSDILGSVHDSLEAFTSGIKIASLVSIAVAIGILSASLNTIAKLDSQDVAQGLFAIGVMLAELSISFRALNKALSKFDAKGLIKAGLALVLLASAVHIMSSALVKLSGLSLGEIAKGLLALGVSLAELCIGLKVINGIVIPLRTSVAVLALAEACKILGDAFAKFGGLSWGEIARGFVGMGVALGELVAAITILQKIGGFKSIFGSLGILILVQGLDDLANALIKFGSMQWDEIGRGLVAMGGALTEVTAATVIAGKLAGFSGIFGATGIAIVIQGLDDLANALIAFGLMQWGEIGRGLVAMGGALAEVSVALIAVSTIAGFAGLFGAGSILIVMKGLDDLANALIKFGSMQWDEIGRGLVAMGGALLEVGGITAAVGVLAGFAGIVGAGTINFAIQGLDDLANALIKFGSMQWDEIGRGLVAMGGALLEIGAISGATGILTGIAGLVGAGTINLAVQGLNDLANALIKFGSMQWDEIGRGLAAMGLALGEVGLGALLNTFSGFGASAISEMAAPLGVLADSVKKWSSVTVPEGLGSQLGELASGVSRFTFSGLGADALTTAAPGVGIMADSVRKWSDVTVPEGLGAQLGELASGISKFTFSGFGADALSTAAPGVGIMADSVKKWSGVTVPEGLGTQLGELASGISKFTFGGFGADALSTAASGVGTMADSVKKWSGVTVPENLGANLSSLASGVSKFTLMGLGADALSTAASGVGKMADSVKKWSGVTVPEGLVDNLKSLAKGIKSFNDINADSSGAKAMDKIYSAASKLAQVNLSSINSGLTGLSSSLKGFGSTAQSITGVGEAITNSLIKPIKAALPTLNKIGGDMASNIINGVKTKQSGVISAMTAMVNAASKAVTSRKSVFRNAGASLGNELANGIKSKRSTVSNAVTSVVSDSSKRARSTYNSMYSAGSYLVDGLASGIKNNAYKAINAATAMANSVASATRKALQINSPSKVFMRIAASIPEGFGMGIDKNADMAIDSANSMANGTIQNVQKAISRLDSMFNTNTNAQPNIRPVVDLSDVRTGVNAISDMFDFAPSVGVAANVNAISSGMNQRIQNGSSREVISAINKLRDKLNNVGNTNYTINGVTYDDGSNVTDAVETLVRYAKIGRRV